MYLFQLKDFVERKIEADVHVVPSDMLDKIKFTPPCGFIVNLSAASEPGTHWIALWIDPTNKNQENDGYLFDSYGFDARVDKIQEFLSKYCKNWNHNVKQLQQVHTRVCGMYAAAFLYYVSNGVSPAAFLRNFTNNLFINDFIIEKMFKKLNE